MSHPLPPTPWWHAPLTGEGLTAQPLLAPWDHAQDYAQLVAAFADPALYHLACGMGVVPDAAYLQDVMTSPPDVHLWRLPAPRVGLGTLLVHSIYTTQHRVGVWSDPGTSLPDVMWTSAITALTSAVLEHEAQSTHVFVHLGVPTQVWQESFLLEAGFDPFEVDAAYSPIKREIYGLTRKT